MYVATSAFGSSAIFRSIVYHITLVKIISSWVFFLCGPVYGFIIDYILCNHIIRICCEEFPFYGVFQEVCSIISSAGAWTMQMPHAANWVSGWSNFSYYLFRIVGFSHLVVGQKTSCNCGLGKIVFLVSTWRTVICKIKEVKRWAFFWTRKPIIILQVFHFF